MNDTSGRLVSRMSVGERLAGQETSIQINNGSISEEVVSGSFQFCMT